MSRVRRRGAISLWAADRRTSSSSAAPTKRCARSSTFADIGASASAGREPVRPKRFTCPYHQWTYGLDGRLRGAPSMPNGNYFDYGRSRARHRLNRPQASAGTSMWQSSTFTERRTPSKWRERYAGTGF